MLLSKHRYSWAEISEMMHRSHGAIARRCRDLGIKDRPVSMELTGKRGTWTSEDFEILADGIRHGDSYAAIGKAGRPFRKVRPLQGLQRLSDRERRQGAGNAR